ncbi:MAG: hypothetical protein VR69_08770 [Peptococcaceae bacterium BRH_c4b]|nr:MAG: hypothetical protein VR69_08770 [Peptococcaceae bacterium BRH_c4b]
MSTAIRNLQELLDVAAGRGEADLYLKGGSMVNVLSGEIYPANVAVWQDKIAYVGESSKMVGSNTTVIDAGGYYLCPALIEPHYHPWMIYNPVSLAEVALCRGITTMVCDNLFFFVQLGAQGLLKLIQFLDHLPVKFLWLARAIHQSPDPCEEEMFSTGNLQKLFSDPRVVKLAEITRWPLIVEGNTSILEKICLAREHRIGMEGHTAGCSYDRLNVMAAAGTESCHEAITAQEVAQRIRLGYWAMLRHSSLRPDLPELLRTITEMNLHTGRMLFTSDACGPGFIAREGLLDGMLRLAVATGVNPVTALQIATINPATYLGLEKELGSISPGRRADILLLPDLKNFTPHMVLSGGQVAAVDGKPDAPLVAPDWDKMGLHTNLPSPDLLNNPSLFGVPSDKPEVFPVVDFVSAVITRQQDRLLQPRSGFLEREEDMLYCTHIDRYGKWLTNGFVKGMGRVEAFASTFTTSFGLMVLGRDRSSMARAAAEVAAMNGGMVLIESGQVSFRLPLQLGGLMSDSPISTLTGKVNELEELARGFGYPYNDILYSILFLSCDFLPGLRMTALGIKDVKSQKIIVPSRNFPGTFKAPVN